MLAYITAAHAGSRCKSTLDHNHNPMFVAFISTVHIKSHSSVILNCSIVSSEMSCYELKFRLKFDCGILVMTTQELCCI